MKKLLCGIALCCASLSPTVGQAELHVWTLKPTQRVLRDEPAGTETSVRLAAARNEWEGFQILIRADEPIGGIQLKAGGFAGADGKPVAGLRTVLYRQHQMYLADPTLRNESFKPGWYSDPLIPAVHPVTGKPLSGSRFSAMPFDLPAEQTHGFWVDVFIPADTKAGQYRATFRVTSGDGKSATVPVTLTVWDFELPRVPAMYTALGSPAERMQSWYAKRQKEGKMKASADWSLVEKQVAQMLS